MEVYNQTRPFPWLDIIFKTTERLDNEKQKSAERAVEWKTSENGYQKQEVHTLDWNEYVTLRRWQEEQR